MNRVRWRVTKLLKWLEHLSSQERLRLLSLEKSRLGGDLINIWEYLKGWVQRGWHQTLFTGAQVTGQEVMGTNWKLSGSSWKSGNTSLGRVTEHWNKLPGEVVESPSLDVVLSNQFKVSLLEQAVWTKWLLVVPSNLNQFLILWTVPLNLLKNMEVYNSSHLFIIIVNNFCG